MKNLLKVSSILAVVIALLSARTVALPGGATQVQSWGSDATGAGIVTADAALKAAK
jgi:hypothetical protein